VQSTSDTTPRLLHGLESLLGDETGAIHCEDWEELAALLSRQIPLVTQLADQSEKDSLPYLRRISQLQSRYRRLQEIIATQQEKLQEELYELNQAAMRRRAISSTYARKASSGNQRPNSIRPRAPLRSSAPVGSENL
jgi:hypothetical protein